ncbi:hypothetical protein GYMLUDRAFT_248911 [Collybiopsis luxurians FD-317 M1]|uniref:HD/PDEase domain-containing protein n=1 Tax=Collybiopsis luxurians FD-317 M1 TaxID=944289 RepID=A0A0D0AX08_9AGAR|nr:hypothetical protein GYMLUDRAFT_248911 [Collybiopsis luxurians FD-317 M1]
MYPSADENIYIDAAEQLMRKVMARYDPSHDAFHVQRVRKTALAIANALPVTPDLLTVELAALLHDVLDKKYVTPEEAADPYSFFVPLFQSAAKNSGIDIIGDGRARQIALIVDNVSWSTEKKLRAAGKWTKWHDECVELHCVQDADRLDAIGAFGILRCAAFSATQNNPLHTPAGDAAEGTSAMQHFADKLIHIRDRLKTEPGKQLAVKRHQLLLDFMHSVDEEFSVINPTQTFVN